NSTNPLLSDPGATGWDGPYLNGPATSSLMIVRLGTGGQPYTGIYYIAEGSLSSPCCDNQWCIDFYSTFDLDSDGVKDTTDAVCVAINGFANERQVITLDSMIDPEGKNAYEGMMNTYWYTDGSAALYVGEPKPY
ncbi:MAG: hypothetical protein KKH25_05340, partial [Candidatus Omnitrophica bacterium]|nr:hypothetical protein [Candidatus Omnitrophota bacterium]